MLAGFEGLGINGFRVVVSLELGTWARQAVRCMMRAASVPLWLLMHLLIQVVAAAYLKPRLPLKPEAEFSTSAQHPSSAHKPQAQTLPRPWP